MRSIYRSIAAAFVLAVIPELAHAQALSLDSVYAQVRARNPRLQAMAAVVDARAAMEASAKLPPDPELQIGAMNVSLPGLSADMPSSMVPSIQLMQMLPTAGKLGASGRIARVATAIARAQADETWWQVRAEAAMAFYELQQADREIAVMKETLELTRRLQKTAQAMYASGEGRQADVLRAGVEISRMQADITRMQAMRTVAQSNLNALLDNPADMPIPVTGTTRVQAIALPLDTLIALAESNAPMIERGRAELEQARARLSLARREIWPDITIGLQYGQRPGEMDMGAERMGSAMIGFTLPVFAGKRQLKMRDEASAMQRMAEADLADMRARVRGRIAALVADIERARSLIALYTTDVLPQANANVESSFSSYRVGAVDFMTLLDAQMTVNTYRQELAKLEAAYGTSLAELEMTIGRELR